LELTRPPLDLSDRGVDCRETPGGLDAYLTKERMIYRPDEKVFLSASLRDAAPKAVAGLPLSIKVARHDGLEVYRQLLSDKGAGGYLAEM
jgi:uncharacterized protein YfaS (alpha-2-macroglobulin family)